MDALRYEDQIFGELKDRLKQKEIKKLTHANYVKAMSGADRDAKRRIAWIVGEGTILRGSGGDAMGTDEGFTSGAFVRMCVRLQMTPVFMASFFVWTLPAEMLLRPDGILREVKLLRDKKPLVISMSDAAASGGYYVSMTGDPIVAYPNTITGSIGVLWGKLNTRGLYDKLGVQKEILRAGKMPRRQQLHAVNSRRQNQTAGRLARVLSSLSSGKWRKVESANTKK